MIDLATARPRDIEAYLRGVILEAHGDQVENSSTVSASKGYYSVTLLFSPDKSVEFRNFRKQEAKRIAKAIRSLK